MPKYRTDLSQGDIARVICNVLENRSYLEVEAFNLGTTIGKLEKCYHEFDYDFWDELVEVSKWNEKYHPNYRQLHFKYSYEERKKINMEREPKKPNLGKKFSEETKLKMSNARIGMRFTREHKAKLGVKLRKPVVQLNDNGEVIKEWESVTAACKDPKYAEYFIRSFVNGKIKYTRGLHFKYKHEIF